MEKQKPTSDEWGILLLLAATLFGAWFRIMPAWLAGFPVNDGGMFYTMILDLQANHFIPPLVTTYNHLSIPFAYPPFGIYFGAGLSSVFNITPLAIIRWLPGIVNALCVPAFYFFAKQVLEKRFQSGMAALVYAMTPHLTSWLSMGGGLTRSFGMLFMLLMLGYVYRVFALSERRSIWGAIIFGGLTVLSHTEAPLYGTAIAVSIWAMKSRTVRGLRDGSLIALGVMAIAGPWYGMVIYREGMTPFLSIAQTGAQSLGAIFKILNVAILTEEPYLGLIGALGILGAATLIAKRDYFIPLLLPVIFLAGPRSAHIMGNIPLALAAGYFVVEIILPALAGTQPATKGLWAFATVLIVYIFGNSMSYGLSLSERHISSSEQAAMQWIAHSTPVGAKFLVISGEPNAFCDSSNEWFPSLTNRESVTTIQGSEWLLGGKFGENALQVQSLQSCIDEGMECFARETVKMGKTFDYVYISIAPLTENCGHSSSSARTTRGLEVAVESSGQYSVAYRSGKVILFKKE